MKNPKSKKIPKRFDLKTREKFHYEIPWWWIKSLHVLSSFILSWFYCLIDRRLGMELGLPCKIQTRKGLFTWGKLLYAERSLDLIHRQLLEIAPKRSWHSRKNWRWSIFQLACCFNDVWVLPTQCNSSWSI